MEKIFFEYVEFYKFLPTPLFDHRLDDRGGKRLTHVAPFFDQSSTINRFKGKNTWARLHDKQKVLAARKRECHASDLVRPRVTGKNEFSS